jgi:hypothetical protein
MNGRVAGDTHIKVSPLKSSIASLTAQEPRNSPPIRPRLYGASVLRASPLFLILATVLACADNFADPDLWMHIKVGQVILATWRIPATDVYSYSAAGLPWRNHEWLAQVMLAVAYGNLGVVGLKLLKFGAAAVTVCAIAAGLARTAAPAWVQRIVLLAAAAGIAVQMQFRPHLFTFAMLSIVIATIAAEVLRGRARMWPLIPAFVLWANLHGGFIVGLGVLTIAAIVLGAEELWTTGAMTRGSRIAAHTLACAAATLLNPAGVRLWSGVLHSVSDPVIRLFVNDWVSLPAILLYQWRHDSVQLVPFALPLIMFAGLAVAWVLAPARDDLPLVAIAGVFIAAAFESSRNTDLAVIAVSIPLAHHWGLALRSSRDERAGSRILLAGDHERTGAGGPGLYDSSLDSAHSNHLNPVLIAASTLLLAIAGGVFSNRLVTWEPVPRGAVEFMKRHRLHGNILNNFDWGEYLVWHLAPDSRVFIDGRCELVYPDPLLTQYLDFLYGRPGGRELLDRYPHDLALLKVSTGAYQIVSADSRWKEIYRDSFSALFARVPIAKRRLDPVKAVEQTNPGKGASLFP